MEGRAHPGSRPWKLEGLRSVRVPRAGSCRHRVTTAGQGPWGQSQGHELLPTHPVSLSVPLTQPPPRIRIFRCPENCCPPAICPAQPPGGPPRLCLTEQVVLPTGAKAHVIPASSWGVRAAEFFLAEQPLRTWGRSWLRGGVETVLEWDSGVRAAVCWS